MSMLELSSIVRPIARPISRPSARGALAVVAALATTACGGGMLMSKPSAPAGDSARTARYLPAGAAVKAR